MRAEADVLGGLKALYLQQLKERLATLDQVMMDIKLGCAEASSYEALQFEVHRLNGTGATYGFPAISTTAEILENHLRSPDRSDAHVIKLLGGLMNAITDTLMNRTAEAAPTDEGITTSKPQDMRKVYKPTVLVADDDPAILNLVQQLLSPWMTVECAQSGRAALDAIEGRRFDLVILDCELTDMTGLDVLLHIGRMESDIRSPVMMLSAVRDPEKVSRLIAAGAQNYLIKPISPDRLIERISILLHRQKKIIMVVDDDPLIREIFRKRLTQRGHEVVLATNGAQALSMARRSYPQAIVLDRQMPRLDGLQFLQELRREDKTRSIPVIMLSAKCESDDIYAGYREGANAYISKPFVPDQVIDTCESFLRTNSFSGAASGDNFVYV